MMTGESFDTLIHIKVLGGMIYKIPLHVSENKTIKGRKKTKTKQNQNKQKTNKQQKKGKQKKPQQQKNNPNQTFD